MSKTDDELFGRLIMEINQAGLSWEIVLNKYPDIKKAYANFNITKIATFKDKEIEAIKNNSKVIRHELKIRSIVYNAQQILSIQKEFGTFGNWISKNRQNSIENWTSIFKKNFKFVGKEIVSEFLMSNGMISGAHDKDCPVYLKIKK
tara:strand:- start:357 stop:797 length:441 start_codon:yes stop_codon:yes gene_type:complete